MEPEKKFPLVLNLCVKTLQNSPLNLNISFFMIIYFNGLLSFPPLGTIIWQKMLWDLFCPPCFGSQETEEPWEGQIWCYFSPTNSSLSDSKCLQKEKKSKHKYLEWKYKSPEPHTECSLSEQEGLTTQALFVVSNVSERFSGWFVHV